MPLSKATAENTKKAIQTVKRLKKVPRMRAKNKEDIIAILAADIHLQEKAPIARSAEPDWYVAMRRPLAEIESLREETGAEVIYAGDIFDKWNPSPGLINFTLDWLPGGNSVAGQHDLLHHRYKDIAKTGYWTLVKTGKLVHCTYSYPVVLNSEREAWMYGYSWDHKIKHPSHIHQDVLQICVAHQYIWNTGRNSYTGAPKENHINSFEKVLLDFDVAIFGDNHKGFLTGGPEYGTKHEWPWILNCGSLMRRHIDQRNYKPRVGLLHEDGTITEHFLDTSKDKFLDEEDFIKKIAKLTGAQDLVREFTKLSDGEAMDFLEVLSKIINDPKIKGGVKDAIVRAMEGAK